MVEKEDVTWGVAQRFEFLEWRIFWVGRVNRSDIEERFGVSTPQASLDLRAYQEVQPGNIEYDATKKAYVPSANFRPYYLRLSADRYLIQLDAILNHAIAPGVTWFGSPPPAAVMPRVARSIEPKTLQAVLRAIERRLELKVEYQSLKSSRERVIVPHSLAFDGYRWHTRAWCVEHNDFRDFVISRFLSATAGNPSKADPTNDIEWTTPVELIVVAHPKLDQAQRATIEHDYGMQNGRLVIQTRAALSYYLIKRLNLDLPDDVVSPERKQIFLTNLAEVDVAVKFAQEATKRRVVAISSS